ncbi:MAG: histidine phosphatase family protein [Solirubrobacterales bacterium]
MANKIYLIRHAAVNKPKEKIYAGNIDLKLSDEGIIQANKLGEFFSTLNIKKVYSSYLSRAVDTGKIISEKCFCQNEIMQGFQEINLGKWEGMPFSEIKEKNPEEFAKRGKDMLNFSTPLGESFFQVQQRAWSAFLEIAEKTFVDETGDVVIVSHDGVNKTIISKITGIDFNECFNIKYGYCSVNVITSNNTGYHIAINVSLDKLQQK